jgi:hypothetical protein
MKVKHLVLAAIIFLLAIPLHVEAQNYESIDLYKGTDSAIHISLFKNEVWITTNDSLVIMRRDVWELNNTNQRVKKNRHLPAVQEILSFSGKIIGWHHSQNFRIDGFYLQTGKDTILVDFINPTLAARAKNLNENVEVSGTFARFPSKEGHRVLRMTKIQDEKDTIYRPMNYVFYKNNFTSENILTGSGKITQLQSPKSILMYAIVEDKVVLQFTFFKKTKSVSRKLKIGSFVEYTGEEIPLREGEIIDGNYKVIRCHTITIDGKQYTITTGGGWSIDGIRL